MDSWEPVDIDSTDRDEIEEEYDKWDDNLMDELEERFNKLKKFNATLELLLIIRWRRILRLIEKRYDRTGCK